MREEISWAVKFFIDAELLAAGRLPPVVPAALSRLA
jgi:hypothetical protein